MTAIASVASPLPAKVRVPVSLLPKVILPCAVSDSMVKSPSTSASVIEPPPSVAAIKVTAAKLPELTIEALLSVAVDKVTRPLPAPAALTLPNFSSRLLASAISPLPVVALTVPLKLLSAESKSISPLAVLTAVAPPMRSEEPACCATPVPAVRVKPPSKELMDLSAARVMPPAACNVKVEALPHEIESATVISPV